MRSDRTPDLSGMSDIPHDDLEVQQFLLAPFWESFYSDLDTMFDRRQVGMQLAMVEDLIQDWDKPAPD
ncbi:MAG TPA: hypothetical protein GXX50_07415 [Firmicutes bacterium]|uniref:hypothetical protein n=1 Tax=Gelria sp. Kuro-4 TaxID=2796927 RepID=UPI0019AB4F81|nr:hypothetical protein [Gelria sp. Kuro-4]BCV25203.1 hypothetical protein kuro4_19760 [Gelria sp. Kuro-4]HHV57573.1 hypothetical protein [Bacillota bacterium]